MDTSDKHRFKPHTSNMKISFRMVDTLGDICGIEMATGCNFYKTGLQIQTERYITPKTRLNISLDLSDTPLLLECLCLYCRESDTGVFESALHLLKMDNEILEPYLSFINNIDKTHTEMQSLRPQTRKMTDVVKRIAGEHKIINQYVVVLGKILQSDSPDLKQTATLMGLMKKDLMTHFSIEENLFFKVARNTLPVHFGDMISKLTLEHRQMLQSLETLSASLKYRIDNGEPAPPHLKENLAALLEKIRQHAKIELTELFPQIEGNLKAKKIIQERLREIIKV